MKRIFSTTLTGILFFLSLSAAQSKLPFKHLTDKDGLSQSSVTCILQDSKGFMWFGTQDGLNRYDGYNLKIFKNNPLDSTSLTNNFIFSIYETAPGRMYIETQDGAFHKYIPQTESFLLIKDDLPDFSNARVSTVGARLLESSGIRWDGGLSKPTGLKRTDLNTGAVSEFKHNPNDPYSIGSDKIYSIYRDRSHNLWIGTDKGLDRFDEKTGRFKHYRSNPARPASLPDNWIWPIFEDSRGNLWIGTARGGLCKFNRDTETFTTYQHDVKDPESINDNFIFSISEDRSGLLWVGTNLGGVSYCLPVKNPFDLYRHNEDDSHSLSDNVVLSLLADRNGAYWIGTRNGGLNKLNPKTGRFQHFDANAPGADKLLSNSIQCLFEDHLGKIWTGTYSSGLSVFDPRTNAFKHYIHDPDKNSLSDNRIYSITEDARGDIWIGTYGRGVNKLDRKTGTFSIYKNDKDDSTSLSANSTWTIAFDESGNLWTGTFGKGLNILNPESGIVEHYYHDPEDSTSIADDNIIRIIKARDGTMWIGTTKGLSRFSSTTKTFTNYNETHGLCNSFIYGIAEDAADNLWLSTNNGLSRFDPRREVFKNYYQKDGLQGNEFNQNAYANDYKTGRLLFGGPDGFNVFHPDSLRDNSFVPPVEFTDYLRYNMDDIEGKPIYEKGISEREQINLSYKDNIITLGFSALSFYNNQANRYRYKLDGFNDNWIQLGNKHTVTFTNLSAGEYTLYISGSNNDGVWNESGRSVAINVIPPWWKTRIAYSVYLFILFTILYAVRRIEINRREQQSQIRESALRIKATEAEKRALESENDRKSRELEAARDLQLSMLPRQLPQPEDLEIAAYMRTATEVGGDYYDMFVQDDGVLNIAFGDATGHGLKAGTMVTLMKGFFTSDASRFGLVDFMNHCNRVIKEIKLGRIVMSFSYIKLYKKVFQVTSAGMPPIYVYRAGTDTIEEILIEGMPLGALKGAKYRTEERELASGDVILLLTDGLPEQENAMAEQYSYDRVRETFMANSSQPPGIIIDKLVSTGDDWSAGSPQLDDISFVVIRVK